MKKTTNLFIIIYFLSFNLNAQNIGEYFYGNQNGDFIQNTIMENDSIMITVGAKLNSNNKYDAWFQKINLNSMKTVFEKTFSSQKKSNSLFGICILKKNDGNYVIGGKEKDSIYYYDTNSFALEFNNTGSVIWQNTYTEMNCIMDLKEKPDGFYAGGYTQFAVPSNGILAHLSKDGKINFYNEFVDLTQSNFKHVFYTDDNNLMLIGRTSVNAVGFQGVLMIKTDLEGIEIWRKRFDTQFDEDNLFYNNDWIIPLGVIQKSDGSYLIVNPTDDVYGTTILNISKTGSLIKKITINPSSGRDKAYAINVMSDGNYLISGENNTSGEISGFSMIVDPFGNIIKRINLGTKDVESKFFVNSVDNNFIYNIGYKTKTSSFKNADGYILKSTNELFYTANFAKLDVFHDNNNNCNLDTNEVHLSNFFLKTNDKTNSIVQINGTQTFNFIVDTLKMELLNPDTSIYEICNPFQSIIKQNNGQLTSINFLVKNKNRCPKTEISITQPELVRCNKAKYYLTVKNAGNESSDELVANITFDKDLTILNADENYTQKNNTISFNIGVLKSGASKIIGIDTKLDCDIQLSSYHEVKAELIPIECNIIENSPLVDIKHNCTNGVLKFICTNVGNQDMSEPWKCVVYLDQYRLIEEDLVLKMNEIKEFSFNTSGNTYTIVCTPPNEKDYSKFSSLSIDNCSVAKNGLNSVGYSNSFRKNDYSANISLTGAMNIAFEPNRIEELSGKLGIYHFIDDKNPIEFCARVRNNTGKIQDSIEFVFSFSNNLDISTFRLLSSNKNAIVQLKDANQISLKMYNLQLSDFNKDTLNASAFARFRIDPFSWSKPDTYKDSSLFIVYGDVFFNKTKKIILDPGRYNYYKKQIVPFDNKYIYSDNMIPFKGKYYDFGEKLLKTADNNILLLTTTNSYSIAQFLPLFTKCDRQGKVLWQKVINIGEGISYFTNFIESKDGNYFALFSYLPVDSAELRENFEVVLLKLDKEGNFIWRKSYKPGANGNGGYANSMILSSDNNLLISGISNNGGNAVDNYLIKVNLNGDTIWKKNYIVEGIAFNGASINELSDGSYIISGSEASVNEYPIYYQKVDKNGNEIWAKYIDIPFGVPNFDYLSAKLDKNDNLIMLGYSQWYIDSTQTYFIEPSFYVFDKNGKYIKDVRPILGPNYFFPYNFMIENEDIYVYGEGIQDTVTFNSDFGIAKLDNKFNKVWEKEMGNNLYESVSDALFISKDSIFLWGTHQATLGDNDLNCVLGILDVNNLNVSNKEIAIKFDEIKCFPNPSSDKVYFINSNERTFIESIQLFDLNGKLVLKNTIDAPIFTLDISNFNSGIYFYQIRTNDNKIQTGKVIVIK